jgi:predicted unusual protein kinase regulating ubiquinone biosynthesis (AarF/ABC1/UbiB family)
LSSRADILPLPYLEVLSELQDNVPPAEFSEVKTIIELELGKLDTLFENFNTTPLSGASLGQVYLAKYNGKDVIVKVSRPRIEEVIEKDILIMKKILPLATRFIDPNIRFSVEGMLAQFTDSIREEMDYRIEAQNLLMIRKNLANEKMVRIPALVKERSSQHVLTLEYLPGVKVTDVNTLDSKGFDRERIVTRVHQIFFKMLLRDNIFHADPHPGNIAIADDGAIILYDFGMVGRLDNETRIKLVRLYLALIDQDPRRTVNVMIELGTLEPTANRFVVEKALEMSIDSLHGRKAEKMEVKALMDLANKTMSRFPFKLPRNLALYIRMSSILEGIYHYHNVNFEFVKVFTNLLVDEGLAKDAYISEVGSSIKRFIKGLDSFVYAGPSLLSNMHTMGNPKSQANYSLAILGGASLIGGSIVLQANPAVGIGLFCAAAAAAIAAFAKR